MPGAPRQPAAVPVRRMIASKCPPVPSSRPRLPAPKRHRLSRWPTLVLFGVAVWLVEAASVHRFNRPCSACLSVLGCPSIHAAEASAPSAPTPPNTQPPATSAGSGAQAEAAALKREAVEVAGQVAAAYPEDPYGVALLGAAYFNNGQSAEATRHLQRCLQLKPDLADAYDVLARVAYEKGEVAESVRLGQEALRIGPPNPDILNRLGRSLLDLGRTDESIQVLQQAVSLPRPSGESHYLLGQAQLQSGNPARARDSFLQATTVQPDHTQAFFGLYTACLRLGQADEAARYRAEFQRLESVDRGALSDRGMQQDTLSGLPMVRQTVARTLLGVAQIHRSHQHAEKALAWFRRAAELDPDQPAARSALEGYYVQAKSLAEGVSVFEKLTAQQPNSRWNHYFLGRLHARLEQVDAAEKEYRKVVELAPNWAEGHRALADLLLRADRHLPEARTLAARAVQLEPSGFHYQLLAGACVKNGDRAGAVAAIRKAIELEPNEPRYPKLLRQLEAAP